MLIHLLQNRRPPALPCLQSPALGPPTTDMEVGGVRVAWRAPAATRGPPPPPGAAAAAAASAGADGAGGSPGGWGPPGRPRNTESLAALLHAFFRYWARGHDYGGAVLCVRTGGFLAKRAKGWATRVGSERHLLCVEDPFEVGHDLGRVVDARSLRALRFEFARAADVLRDSPDPLPLLLEPYVPSPRGGGGGGVGGGEGGGGEGGAGGEDEGAGGDEGGDARDGG